MSSLTLFSFFIFLGERPYKCHMPECGRAFIQLSNLQQHLRNHDAQVERAKSRPFHCNICGKGFATESSLRTHTSKVSDKAQKGEYYCVLLKHFINLNLTPYDKFKHIHLAIYFHNNKISVTVLLLRIKRG